MLSGAAAHDPNVADVNAEEYFAPYNSTVIFALGETRTLFLCFPTPFCHVDLRVTKAVESLNPTFRTTWGNLLKDNAD